MLSLILETLDSLTLLPPYHNIQWLIPVPLDPWKNRRAMKYSEHVTCLQLYWLGKKHFFLSRWWTSRLFLSQILVDLFNWILIWVNQSCTMKFSRCKMNRLRCKKLVSEFGPRSRYWLKSHRQSLITITQIGLKPLFFVFFFFETKIKICVFIGLGILFYHQPRLFNK